MGIITRVNFTELIFFTWILKLLVTSHRGGQQWCKHTTSSVRLLDNESILIVCDQENRRKFELKDDFGGFLKTVIKAAPII